MKPLKAAIVSIFLLSAAALFAAEAQDVPSIKSSISRKRIFVGDRIRYTVEISSRRAIELEFPEFKDNKIDNCEIKDSGQALRKRLFGRGIVYIKWFDITSYYVGEKKLPALEIKYRDKGGGEWKILKTREFSFKVESVLLKHDPLKDVRDIKGLIYPFSFFKLFLWTALVLFVLIVLYFFIKALLRPPAPKPPHEAALDELKLARERFASGGGAKDYYVEISDAIRRYIEAVFALRAPEMTTQEFLNSMSAAGRLPVSYRESLKNFMEACDLVKFARHAPNHAETEAVFETAKKFIEETKEKADVHI